MLGGGVERGLPQLQLLPQRPGLFGEQLEALARPSSVVTAVSICVMRRSTRSTVPTTVGTSFSMRAASAAWAVRA